MVDHIAEHQKDSTRSTESLKSVSQQAVSAGRDLKDKASELAAESAETLKGQVSGVVDAARVIASQASDQLKDKVTERKGAGADYVGSIAETIRRAAREFDTELPIAGSYMRKAAFQVDGVSESIRTGNFNDVVRNAQDFARRQPTAFLGLAALAGFAVVRFLKSSSDAAPPSDTRTTVYQGTPGYRDDLSK